jgi:hypothetical protein
MKVEDVMFYLELKRTKPNEIKQIEAQTVDVMHTLDMNSVYDIQTAFESNGYYKVHFKCIKTKTPIKESWFKELAISLRIRKRSFQFTENLVATKGEVISENDFIDFMWLYEKTEPKYFRIVKEFVTSHQEQVFQV